MNNKNSGEWVVLTNPSFSEDQIISHFDELYRIEQQIICSSVLISMLNITYHLSYKQYSWIILPSYNIYFD